MREAPIFNEVIKINAAAIDQIIVNISPNQPKNCPILWILNNLCSNSTESFIKDITPSAPHHALAYILTDSDSVKFKIDLDFVYCKWS